MNKIKTIKISKLFLILVVFLFALTILKLIYVGLSNDVDGINLTTFANNRNTRTKTLNASRGTIYDLNGEVLAQDVNSYTVIAYLDSSRTTQKDNPHHVIDKEKTAKLLSPIINMTEKKILALLSQKLYQVELGPGGRGITELVKEQIEDLDLPGIDFISSTKRYYPKANFLSYTLGYSKTNEEGNIYGEFGLELFYNDRLTGKNGYKKYQQDIYGYQIANTPSIEEKAVSGDNIYLTIDTNIQMFAENAIEAMEEVGLSWATVSVTEAKTGKILAIASSPNFNPNILDLKSYSDPFVSYAYEPGSTMKIFSWLASIENGLYKPNDKFQSGNIEIDGIKIYDWRRSGWGKLTYDEGFVASSNAGASNLALTLGREKLKDFYSNLGFGAKTGISLPAEQSGSLKFQYPVEIANAAFGQGISITASQMVQALTTIANNGTTLKPYLVEKIVDANGKIVYEGKKEEIGKTASKESVDKVKDLMYKVVNSDLSYATGTSYKIKEYDIIAKTGTAQIASKSGGYLSGSINYIRSFAGMFPKDDPEIIIYIAVSKITSSSALSKATKNLIKDVATYRGINSITKNETTSTIKLDNYISSNVKETLEKLKSNSIINVVIGNGERIISQYPSKGTLINKNDKLFLTTNSEEYKMINIKGWSRNDVEIYASLIGINVNFDGYGYVKSYSIKEGSLVDNKSVLDVTLEPIYKSEEKEDSDT